MKISAIYLFIALIASSCHFMSGKRINGNGNMHTQQHSVGDFDGVRVRGGIDVEVANGPNSFKIEADENLMQYIEVHNSNGVIEVSSKDGYNLNPSKSIKVYATAPTYTELQISGSGDIKSSSKITGSNNLNIGINGSGDVDVNVDAPKVAVDIKGSGSMKLKGNTRNFTADIKGSGDIYGFDLLSERTDIDISGSGNAQVFASKQLNVDIKGAGDVAYKGTANVQQDIKGAGNVKKVD